MQTTISIAILRYPDCAMSAVYGLYEMFLTANRYTQPMPLSYFSQQANAQAQSVAHFVPNIVDYVDQERDLSSLQSHVLIVPPALGEYYLSPNKKLLHWLKIFRESNADSIIAAACAGVFLLAEADLLLGRKCTTHWDLAEQFKQRFPDIVLDSDKILVEQGDLLTAGGMMSWIDLGLELVKKFTSEQVMRQLGKMLVVDTASREQRSYQQFQPNLRHQDQAILTVQAYIADHLNSALKVKQLADLAHMHERSLLRRFSKATGLKPTQYIQRARIQRACDLLESTQLTFERIAYQVGYQDVSACRKLFNATMGVSPKVFRQRFVMK